MSAARAGSPEPGGRAIHRRRGAGLRVGGRRRGGRERRRTAERAALGGEQRRLRGHRGGLVRLPLERARIVHGVHVILVFFIVGEREAIGFVRPGEAWEKGVIPETPVYMSVSW